MHFTVNEIFKKIKPHIPEALVSSEVISIIERFNEKLPAELTTGGGLECPLGIDTPVADWQLCVKARNRERDFLRETGENSDNFLFNSYEWQPLRSFSAIWNDPQHVLYKNTPNIWLEFDLDSLKQKIPVPCIFFSVKAFPGKDDLTDNEKKYDWLINTLEAMQKKPLKKDIRNKLIYCLDALPAKGKLTYAALMISRPLEGVRIVVTIPEKTLGDYLSDIKYSKDNKELLELAGEMSQFTCLRYNLDISDRVLPKLGIECFLKDRTKTHKETWKKFLEHLTERTLCTSKKKDALLSWPGHIYTTLPQDSDPVYIFKRISHIKIIYEKDKPLLAKAYPEFFSIFEVDLIYTKILHSLDPITD